MQVDGELKDWIVLVFELAVMVIDGGGECWQVGAQIGLGWVHRAKTEAGDEGR